MSTDIISEKHTVNYYSITVLEERVMKICHSCQTVHEANSNCKNEPTSNNLYTNKLHLYAKC